MTQNRDFFKPESVDKQVDLLSLSLPSELLTSQEQAEEPAQTETRRVKEFSTPDQIEHQQDASVRLVNELQAYYQVEHQQNLGFLEHARRRIAAYQPANDASAQAQSPFLSLPLLRSSQGRMRMMQNQPPTDHSGSRKIFRRMSLLAATLVAALLVGMLVAALTLSHNHQSNIVATQQTATPTSAPIIVSVSATNKIFSGNATILANRASDGRKIWSYVTNQQVAVHAVIVVQAHVVYARVNEQVYALQASDGKLLWHLSLPWVSSTPSPDFSHDTSDLVVDHGLVFTQLAESNTGTSMLFALRANNGKVLWQYQTGGEELFAVASGKVYAATYLNHTYLLVALEETTGHFLWSYSGTASFIAQQDNHVYIVSIVWNIPQGGTSFDAKSESTLLALDTENGKVLWSNKIVTTFFESTNIGHMIVDNNKLIFFNGSHFCAYQTSNGQELWCSQHDPSSAGSMVPFALVNNTIYATYFPANQDITQLEALDSNTGTVLWSRNVSDPQSLMHGLIAIMGDKIYLLVSRLSGAESISALSLNNGYQLWQYDFPFMTLAAAGGS